MDLDLARICRGPLFGWQLKETKRKPLPFWKMGRLIFSETPYIGSLLVLNITLSLHVQPVFVMTPNRGSRTHSNSHPYVGMPLFRGMPQQNCGFLLIYCKTTPQKCVFDCKTTPQKVVSCKTTNKCGCLSNHPKQGCFL